MASGRSNDHGSSMRNWRGREGEEGVLSWILCFFLMHTFGMEGEVPCVAGGLLV